MRRHETLDRTVSGVPYVDATAEAGVTLVTGLGINNVNRVILSDEDVVGPAKLVPGTNVLVVLCEDLDAVISTVDHKEAVL